MRRGEEAECGVTLLIAFTRKLRSDYTGSQTTSTWVLSDTVPSQWVLWEYAPGDGMHYSLSRLDDQINCRLNTFIIFLLCRTADKEGDRKYKRGRKWCDMQQRSPAVNPTVGVLVAGYASWSLGHKTSQIMSCKHTPFRSLWPCWGVFHAVQHGSRNQDLDICCEKQVWETPYGWCPRVSPMSSVLFYFCGCCTNKEQLCAWHDQSWHWETGSQPHYIETSSILQCNAGWWKLCDNTWIQLTEWVRMRCFFSAVWRFGVLAE